MTSFKNSICERCLKHCAEHSAIHTCTPTNGWAAMEAEIARLRQQRDELVAALKGYVTAMNRSAKAEMSYQNARENFSDAVDERKHAMKMLLEASKAEGIARAALAKIEGSK